MKETVLRKWRSSVIRGLLASLLVAGASLAGAQTNLTGTTVNITGNADRMISYRFQEHMWQTDDGATHLMVNRGSSSAKGALTLYSSTTNGASWTAKIVLPNTDGTSTADGVLSGNDLRMVYSDNTGSILSVVLRYDPTAGTWKQQKIQSPAVFSDATKLALNPGLAIDAQGTMWCAYTVQDLATLASEMRIAFRTTANPVWVDSGQVIGNPGSNGNLQRSGKPVRIPGGMGLMASVEEKMLWATRRDGDALTAPWTVSTIFVSTAADTDPYGGHFSVIDDLQNNLHMITPDGGVPLYFRFDYGTQAWEAPRALPGASKSGYVQATRVGSSLLLISNNATEQAVYRSDDLGASFPLVYRLKHQRATGTTSFQYPRVESPGVSRSPVPVVQQYTTGATQQRLLWWELPVN